MYTEKEIAEIQEIILGKRVFSPEENERLTRALPAIPQFLNPFIGLLVTNPDLYQKLAEDELIAKMYSAYAFFPETFELVFYRNVKPEISFGIANRGIIAIIKHPEKEIVIKPYQSPKEPTIAQIADELEVGPKQLQTLEGFITEQFVKGKLFSRINASNDAIYEIGRRVGSILSSLHSRGICYNDTILCDDFKKSHLIIPETSPAILFDYGVAISTHNHPDYTDEDVFNFAKTLPEVNVQIGNMPSIEQIQFIIQYFRPILQSASKEEILGRDINFLNEGLSFASRNLGNHIVSAFATGFNETYR